MARRFGQNAFAAVSGVVTAAGLAVCLATGQGKIEVTKHATGATASGAAQIQATQYRIRKVPVLVAQAKATATGRITAAWKIKGQAQAPAVAAGSARADFSGYGTAQAIFQFTANPYRLAKSRSFPAKGTATLEGEAYVLQILQGKPAVGTATLYGTTYQLAYGTAVGGASAQGRMVWTAGAKAHAEATAEATGQAVYTVALYGLEAVSEAHVQGHEAVTRNGIRYLEAFGEAIGEVLAENSFIGVHPSVTAFVSADAQARGTYFLGGKGHAQGYCTLQGTMLAATTAVTLVESVSVASATGRIRAWHKFKGEAVVAASGSGTPLVTKTGIQGQGLSSAAGSGSVIVINTKVYPDTGYGVANGKATMNRVRKLAGGPVTTYAVAQAQIQRIHISYGVAKGKGTLNGIPYKTSLFGGKAQAKALAEVTNIQLDLRPAPAQGVVQALGQIERTHVAGGEATGVAMATGGIQVNDAAKAPAARTVMITKESRTALVLTESRTVVV